MTPPIYHVFVQRNGKFGVSLSQGGVIIRTESTFQSAAEAKTWIELDGSLTRDLPRLQVDKDTYNLHVG